MDSILGTGSLLVSISAVGISIVTYVLTNRREDKKWGRDALMGAMIEFLDGSFARYSEEAYDLAIGHSNGTDTSNRSGLQKYRERSRAGHRSQNAALTRLRLLASDQVVEEAEKLLAEDQKIVSWFESPNAQQSWLDLNRSRQQSREQFISSYRKTYRLGAAKPIVNQAQQAETR